MYGSKILQVHIISSIILNVFVIWTNSGNKDVFNTVTIKNTPVNYLENHIIKKEGRIITLCPDQNPPGKDLYKHFTFNFATLFDNYHFGGYDPMISKLNYEYSLGLNHINCFRDYLTKRDFEFLSAWGLMVILVLDTSRFKHGN